MPTSKCPSTGTPKFQTYARSTKPVPNEALTRPKFNATHDSTQQRTHKVHAPIISRSALAQSLEAPIQRSTSNPKMYPMYAPPHNYLAPTTSSTHFAYKLLSEPKSIFQHIFYPAQSTINSNADHPTANKEEEIAYKISTFSAIGNSRLKIHYQGKSSI